MATKLNLTIDQGSEFANTFTVVYANGTAWDLTGYTGRGQMRKSPTSSTAKDFTVSPVANGQVTLSMTSAYSANVAAGRWLYDVEVVAANGDVTRVREGIVTVTPEMTRS